MWADARRNSGSDDLLRQAFLLTGDPDRAERLTGRAVTAAQHRRRAGAVGPAETARAELVRGLLAAGTPGGHARVPLPAGRHAAAWSALGALPVRRRVVLVLRYAEGLTDEQIADLTGSTPRAVEADGEAGLLALRPALAGDRQPGRLVAAALADAGRRWADHRRRLAGQPADPWAMPRPPVIPPASTDDYDWWTPSTPRTGAAPGAA